MTARTKFGCAAPLRRTASNPESSTSVIVGATSTRHVDDNVAASDRQIDPGLLEEMSRHLEPVLAPPI